jgi:hypothetical protein
MLLTKSVTFVLSSLVISRNWLPSSYCSVEGMRLIQATFDIAFIGFGDDGRVISTTSLHASDTNSLELKQAPPSLMFLQKVPREESPGFFRFLY